MYLTHVEMDRVSVIFAIGTDDVEVIFLNEISSLCSVDHQTDGSMSVIVVLKIESP